MAQGQQAESARAAEKSRRKPVSGRGRQGRRQNVRRRAEASQGGLFAGLKPNAANFAPLTPISFLPRTAAIHPERVAVVHGDVAPQLRRVARAGAPARLGAGAPGVRPGETVSAMLPNVPAMLEAHFGVPMCGAVLNTINTRLDPRDHRLYPRARRGEGADHRPRIRRAGRPGARAA